MRVVLIILLATLGTFVSCEPQMIDDPIPMANFPDTNINISFPEYSALRLDGGYKEVNSIGLRGVIVYRVNSTTFRTYERNCSYHPNEAGSTVNIHTSGLYLEDPSCGSTFNFTEGQPMGGPAWRPLRQYHTVVVGSTVTITADVIN